MYFLIALTIIIGAASRSGPFAISSFQLNNKHTRTLLKTEICFRSYRLQHSTDGEDFFAKQIKSQHPRTKILRVTELKGRYVKNFVKIFGADELLDSNDLETDLITTVRLVAQG
jgi:hypothetical protein